MHGVLHVDTKGTCFLCFNPHVIYLNQLVRPVRGFEKLLRYINVNPSQAFNLSSEFLEALEIEDDIHVQDVSLCQKCSAIAANFYRLHARYEMLQIHLDAMVKSVHEIMIEGDKCTERVQEYRNKIKPTTTTELMTASFASNLREETLKKCGEKLKIPKPPPPKTTYTAIFPSQISGSNQALLIPNEEGQEKDNVEVENVIYAHTTVDDYGVIETEYQTGPYTETEVYIEEDNPPPKPPPKVQVPQLVPEDSDYDMTSSSCFHCPFKATNRRSIPYHMQAVHPEHIMIKHMQPGVTLEECRKSIFDLISQMVYSVTDHLTCIQTIPTFQCRFCDHILRPRFRFLSHLINKHVAEFANTIKEHLENPPSPKLPGGVKKVQQIDTEIVDNGENIPIVEVDDLREEEDEPMTETTNDIVQVPVPAPEACSAPADQSESSDESSDSSDPDYECESIRSPSTPGSPPEPSRRKSRPKTSKPAKPIKRHKKSAPRIYSCEYCALRCSHSGNLRYHTMEAHLTDLVENELPTDTPRYNSGIAITKVLREVRNFKGDCCYCSTRKPTWNALKRHVLASHFSEFVDAIKIRLSELPRVPPVEDSEQGQANNVEGETQAEVAIPDVPNEDAMDQDHEADLDQVNEVSSQVDSFETSELVELVPVDPNQAGSFVSAGTDHTQGISIMSAGADITQGVSIMSAGTDHTQGVSIMSAGADHTQGVSIVSADHTQGVSIVSADHTQGVSITSADPKQGVTFMQADHPQGIRFMSVDHTQAVSFVSADHTQGVSIVSADHTQGVSIVSGDHTQGVSIVSGDHTQGVSIVSGDHTQGVSIVSGDHTQGVSIVSADHTQGISIVPVDHDQGLSMVPMDHSQQVSLHPVGQEPAILVPIDQIHSSNFISLNQSLGYVPNDSGEHELVIVQWGDGMGIVESEVELPQDENSNSSLLRDLEA